MKCYDLFKLPSLKPLEIISGSEGLNREIKWIYFADMIEINDCDKWINENELIIITGKHLHDRLDLLCPVISALDSKLSSGIILNVGDYISIVPETLIQKADELKFPLFLLPWETRLTDVSKEIANYIISANNTATQQQNFLHELLFRENLKDEELANLILNTEFHFEKPCRIAVLFYDIATETQQGKEISSPDTNQHISMNHFLFSLVSSSVNAFHIPAKLTQNNNQIILLVEDSDHIQSILTRFLDKLQKDFHQRYADFFLYIGIGKAYSTPYEYKNSYKEALKAAQIITASEKEPIAFYEKLGYLGILVNPNDHRQMRDFYYNLLGGILEYDKNNRTDFLETLYVYLFSGQSSQDTAAELHLHKNTLKYRISKIESLLQRSLKDPETITEIILARKIAQLLQIK